MSNIAIRVENLSKQYKIGVANSHHDTLRDHLTEGFKSLFRRNGHKSFEDSQEGYIWSLKDVSFDVQRGDVVGVIGKNGAGKSTLLKILSRITEPTEGGADIYGRVGSLLEVGTGFHPELTGRENVYLNGAILGMRKAEIEQKFDEIIAFAETDKFIDMPVKRYSSGMYVRLAFAVAAHLEPEILIVDEVLAVGDTGFQKKCLEKLQGVAQEGRTVLFVSHNMAAVEHLCNKVFMFENGRVAFSGGSKEAIDYYLHSFSEKDQTSSSHIVDLSNAAGRTRSCRPQIDRLELYTDGGRPLSGCLKLGASLMVSVSFRLENPTANFEIVLGFDNYLGQRVFTASTAFQPNRSVRDRVGHQKIICEIPSFTLLPGEYRIKVLLDIAGSVADRVQNAASITVVESNYYGTGKIPPTGFFVLKHRWLLQ